MRTLKIDGIHIDIHDTLSQNYSNQVLENMNLIRMFRYTKPLDNPQPWWKQILATVVLIPQSHTFIVIEADNNIFLSADYYDNAFGSVTVRIR